MYGIDLFFKAAAAGMNVARKSVENMFLLMELCVRQQQSRAEKEKDTPSEKADTAENGQTAPPPPAEPAVSKPVSSAAKETIENEPAPEIKTPEPAPKKVEAKQPAPKRYVGARSEAFGARMPDSAKKAPPAKKKTVPKQKPTPPAATKTVPPKKPTARQDDPAAAIDVVQRVLSACKKPLKTEEIMKATGFNRKKVQDNLYKLKKRGEVQMVEKGVYVKT